MLRRHRNNDPTVKHGRLNFTAQGSRFNFTIKGPMLWGAKTTGFIEMDFDSTDAPIANSSFTASNSYTPRLRHAMFRFNWPTSELLIGQYWSMFCEYYAESAEDGPLQMTGTPTAPPGPGPVHPEVPGRLDRGRPDRQSQRGQAPDGCHHPLWHRLAVGAATAAMNNGQSAETPQLQGKIPYAHDFWGKAAYYGKPTPFTVQFVGGWQRNVIHAERRTLRRHCLRGK